jgi:hypothetical protein
MRLEIALDVAPSEELLALLPRLKALSAGTDFRRLAGLLLPFAPQYVALSASEPNGGRHTWVQTTVAVAWSSVPGHLYTCSRCGCTKRHLPPEVGGGKWVTEYRSAGTGATTARRPRCPGKVQGVPCQR